MEEAKAIKEVARTAGKAIDTSRKTGRWFAQFVDGSLGQISGIIEDKLKYIRWEKQLALIEMAEQKMQERGVTQNIKAIPLKIFNPLIESLFIEEEEEIQKLWMSLLLTAADSTSNVDVQRSYISILQDLSPLDVTILDKIYSCDIDFNTPMHTHRLPDQVVVEANEQTQEPTAEVCLSIANLNRLGLIESAIIHVIGKRQPLTIYRTILGERFYDACAIGKQDCLDHPKLHKHSNRR